jgi:hypothetical protein
MGTSVSPCLDPALLIGISIATTVTIVTVIVVAFSTLGTLLGTAAQGLTLVHFSAQLKRILWDMGRLRGFLGGVWELSGGY